MKVLKTPAKWRSFDHSGSIPTLRGEMPRGGHFSSQHAVLSARLGSERIARETVRCQDKYEPSVMPIINRLVKIYETRDFRVSTGLNSHDFDDYRLAPLTWLFKNGENFTSGLGIAMQEVYFLECLFENYQPRNIFIIGNSFGWSTFALALLNPQAKVLAIDAGVDANAIVGIEFTDRVAEEEGLSIRVVEATSPQDVGPVIEKHMGGPVDFAFIDGHHSNEQIVSDFNAIRPRAAADCVYLFHDIRLCGLEEGIERIERDTGLAGTILLATPSGMGIIYDVTLDLPIDTTIRTFSVDGEILAVIRYEAWREKHRRRVKYKKILVKRLNTVRGFLGKEPLPLP